MLRDPRIERFGRDNLLELQRRIRDPNWRIFAEDGRIHALNNSHYFADPDPFVLFERMDVTDPSHAFYLGYELMKAKTALTLGKNYRQDQALQWGFLTEPEERPTSAAASNFDMWISRVPRSSRPAQEPSRQQRAEMTNEKQRPARDLGRNRHNAEP